MSILYVFNDNGNIGVLNKVTDSAVLSSLGCSFWSPDVGRAFSFSIVSDGLVSGHVGRSIHRRFHIAKGLGNTPAVEVVD